LIVKTFLIIITYSIALILLQIDMLASVRAAKIQQDAYDD